MAACAMAISPAPPTPCSARAAMSSPRVVAMAQRTEAIAKMISATSSSFRRP
jgi:hypothetical protein